MTVDKIKNGVTISIVLKTGPADRSRFQSSLTNWTGMVLNRGWTAWTGGPTGKPDEPSGSIRTGQFD